MFAGVEEKEVGRVMPVASRTSVEHLRSSCIAVVRLS